MRGDITVKFDGVELHDVAANRMASYYALDSNSSTDGTAATAATDEDTAATDEDTVATDEDTVVTDEDTVATDTAADKDSSPANLLTGDASLPPSDEPD